MKREDVKMVAILLLTVFAIWNWWEMDNASTLFEIIKNGFEYVVGIILLVNMMRSESE